MSLGAAVTALAALAVGLAGVALGGWLMRRDAHWGWLGAAALGGGFGVYVVADRLAVAWKLAHRPEPQGQAEAALTFVSDILTAAAGGQKTAGLMLAIWFAGLGGGALLTRRQS